MLLVFDILILFNIFAAEVHSKMSVFRLTSQMIFPLKMEEWVYVLHPNSRSKLLFNVMQRTLVVSYRSFGTTHRTRRSLFTNLSRITFQRSEDLIQITAEA